MPGKVILIADKEPESFNYIAHCQEKLELHQLFQRIPIIRNKG